MEATYKVDIPDLDRLRYEMLLSDAKSRLHGITEAHWVTAFMAWSGQQEDEFWTHVELESTGGRIAVNVRYRDFLDESDIESRVIWLTAYAEGPADDWEGWGSGEPWEGREPDLGCAVVLLHLDG